MNNKRKKTRQSCLVPVEGKKGTEFENIQTVDISETGLGIVSSRRIPINKEIPIEIDLSETEQPVFVVGKVKWVRPIAHSELFRVGVIFKKIMRGSKSRLQKHFKNKSFI